ncbi:MAG: glycosyl hydrolase [Butyrivibrio sp.]|nr:glycosyl hydrolase [Butyrivibrio sp.]
MKELLKKIFWKLPLSSGVKNKIAQKRFERILEKEKAADEKNIMIVDSDRTKCFEYSKYVLSLYKRTSKYYKEYCQHKSEDYKTVLVAYYLTQFHPNKHNDEWWGKGTTEWNNVNQAIPQYIGHNQPRKPGELGYYDLRIKDNLQRQIEMAKNYGVSAFCFYYYWFDNGERLLESPLNLFLNSKELEMKFFYCWANENWTKRFSGTDSDILIKITHTEDNYKRFIDSIINDFDDPRYYKIGEKVVLSVYRPANIPNPEVVLDYWRKRVKQKCGKNLYLIAVQEKDVSTDWCKVGFDAESEFQPKQIEHNCKMINDQLSIIRKDFSGRIYDYADMVNNYRYEIKENKRKKVYSAVMPAWDNTPRRNSRAIIFEGSTPELYKKWLIDIINKVTANDILDDKMIFINAWNEWGEGAYLEPDDYMGYAYLQATWEALQETR